MIRLLLLLLLFLLPTSLAASDYIPQQLSISAPQIVNYDFDGSELQIPVDIMGTPARVIFAVFTRGKADEISRVRNGFRGWHYVDAIDTCVYFSPAYDFQPGLNYITWNAQTHVTYMQEGDGSQVREGQYTYYLWGYDYTAVPAHAVPPLMQGSRGMSELVDTTPNGMPLDRPFFTGRLHENQDGSGPLEWPFFTQYTWAIGNNPYDPGLVETCFLGGDMGGQWDSADGGSGQMAWDSAEFDWFYHKRDSRNNQRATVWKMQWVSNGSAVRDESWGPDLVWNAKIYGYSGMTTDGTYLYTFTHDLYDMSEMSTRAYIIDISSGEMLYDFYHRDWADFDQYAGGAGAQYLNGGGPVYHQVRNGYLWAGNFTCLVQMLDPYRYMETEDYTEYKRWTNGNGDWVSDINWEQDAQYPWACFGETPPVNLSLDVDRLNWVVNRVGQFGEYTFDLFAPDGTGIGYFAIERGSTGVSDHSWKATSSGGDGFINICDGGTPYDGLYVDNGGLGFGYVAQDSFMGTISEIMADRYGSLHVTAAPGEFTVAQNSPNPFNPSTTIRFTIPAAGHVTVEVFNVAGQTVATLVDGQQEAGEHTVVFDGSRLAAGVYFYTVTAGAFMATKKMTLVK